MCGVVICFILTILIPALNQIAINTCYFPETNTSSVIPIMAFQKQLLALFLPPSQISTFILVYTEKSESENLKVVFQSIDSKLNADFVGVEFSNDSNPKIISLIKTKNQTKIGFAMGLKTYTFSVPCANFQKKLAKEETILAGKFVPLLASKNASLANSSAGQTELPKLSDMVLNVLGLDQKKHSVLDSLLANNKSQINGMSVTVTNSSSNDHGLVGHGHSENQMILTGDVMSTNSTDENGNESKGVFAGLIGVIGDGVKNLVYGDSKKQTELNEKDETPSSSVPLVPQQTVGFGTHSKSETEKTENPEEFLTVKQIIEKGNKKIKTPKVKNVEKTKDSKFSAPFFDIYGGLNSTATNQNTISNSDNSAVVENPEKSDISKVGKVENMNEFKDNFNSIFGDSLMMPDNLNGKSRTFQTTQVVGPNQVITTSTNSNPTKHSSSVSLSPPTFTKTQISGPNQLITSTLTNTPDGFKSMEVASKNEVVSSSKKSSFKNKDNDKTLDSMGDAKQVSSTSVKTILNSYNGLQIAGPNKQIHSNVGLLSGNPSEGIKKEAKLPQTAFASGDRRLTIIYKRQTSKKRKHAKTQKKARKSKNEKQENGKNKTEKAKHSKNKKKETKNKKLAVKKLKQCVLKTKELSHLKKESCEGIQKHKCKNDKRGKKSHQKERVLHFSGLIENKKEDDKRCNRHRLELTNDFYKVNPNTEKQHALKQAPADTIAK